MTTKRTRKRAPKPQEKRLYAVVAHKVYVKGEEIYLPEGMMAAQACHATGKYRALSGNADDMTTIVKEARSDKELLFLLTALEGRVDLYQFNDRNPEFYGTKDRPLTAICLGPITKTEAEPLVGHLELM